MKLVLASKEILDQLENLIEQISDEDFQKRIPVLNEATIGQHIRHTLEFFMCLKNNIASGVINYDNRDHDTVIEADRLLSREVINELRQFLNTCSENVALTLESNYDITSDELTHIDTSFNRELAYNIEHAVHHMAIIKIGIKAIAPHIRIPNGFGVAVSTIRYNNSLKP